MSTAYLSAISSALQERLVPDVQDISVSLDPVFPLVVEGAMNVAKDPISKDWKIYYTYTGALTGGVQYSGVPTNNMMLDGTDRVNIIESVPSFPGMRDSVLPSYGRYSIKITGAKGVLAMPLNALQADAALPVMDDVPAALVRNHIKKLAHLQACAWYADVNGGLAKIATDGNIGITHVAGTHKVVVTATAGNDVVQSGRIRRLKPGLEVDLFESDYTAQWNPNGACFIIGAINYLNTASTLTLYFESIVDADAYDAAAAGNNWITPRGAVESLATGKSILPCGYQSWAISTGTLYGNAGDLTITDAPEMASITAAAVGDLTENVLNQYLALFHDARDGEIDTFFTSAGVLVNLLDFPGSNAWHNMERQGQPQRLRLGWDGIDYTYDGRTYKIYQSPYIDKGAFVGLKVGGGNLRRHYPPTMTGTGKQSGYESAVQWIGPMFHKGIWMPVLSGGRVTEGAQAPYMFLTQNSAKDPTGIVLTGCTDDSLGG